MDSKEYFVGNIPFSVDSDELYNFFSKEVGPVKSAVVSYDRETGDHRGFGFVQFHSPLANPRMEKMDGAKLKDRRITVRESRKNT